MRWSSVRTLLSVTLGGIWVLGVVLAGQDHSSEAHRHPDGEALSNPVQMSEESIATGKKYYTFYCAGCHGPGGAGDGGMAMGGSTPSNLTDEEWVHGSSDGEIFLIIRDGGWSPDMEPYGRRIKEPEIWHLVNYIRSLRVRD